MNENKLNIDDIKTDLRWKAKTLEFNKYAGAFGIILLIVQFFVYIHAMKTDGDRVEIPLLLIFLFVFGLLVWLIGNIFFMVAGNILISINKNMSDHQLKQNYFACLIVVLLLEIGIFTIGIICAQFFALAFCT